MKYLKVGLRELVEQSTVGNTAKTYVGKRVKYPVFQGYMEEVPIYERHRRGRNWLAKIELDPSSPGGLQREFMKLGKGSYYYNVSDLEVGDPVEFGADYYSGGGRRSPERLYGVVTGKGSNWIEFEFVSNAKEAIKKAQELREVEGVSDSPLAEFSDEELIAELERRGYRVVK